jgi:hypothetical protein
VRSGGRSCARSKGVDHRAELVAGLSRHQPPSELERVEDLGALPAPELALQHTDIDVGVVGDQGGGVERLEHVGRDSMPNVRASCRTVEPAW